MASFLRRLAESFLVTSSEHFHTATPIMRSKPISSVRAVKKNQYCPSCLAERCNELSILSRPKCLANVSESSTVQSMIQKDLFYKHFSSATSFSKRICSLTLLRLSKSKDQGSILMNTFARENHMSTQALFQIAPYSTKSSQFSNVTSILKNQSALQMKRPSRKKMPKIQEESRKTVQLNNVVAYAVAEEINLVALKSHLLKQGLYALGELPQDVQTALHVRGKYNVDQKPKEIFVFEDGSVVFWCVPEIERGAFLKMLSKFSAGSYTTSLVLFEREEMDFAFSRGGTSLVGEVIHLKEEVPESGHRLLEMYTFSNALAQSVKLAIWEASLETFVTSIEKVTEDLRQGNKIRLSRRQVLMKTGELFALRHLINLSSDLLDTPDFYWEREVLEPLYQSLCNYLNITRRTRVMNEKLNHCCELTELLSSQLNDAHHTRLEVMIIILIMVEVLFEIVHYVERFFNQESSDQEADSKSS